MFPFSHLPGFTGVSVFHINRRITPSAEIRVLDFAKCLDEIRGVRDFQLFVYNGNAFLLSGYPLGIRYADNLLAAKR